MAAARKGRWKLLYEQYQARGLKKTQALVILARKLAKDRLCLDEKAGELRPLSA